MRTIAAGGRSPFLLGVQEGNDNATSRIHETGNVERRTEGAPQDEKSKSPEGVGETNSAFRSSEKFGAVTLFLQEEDV